MCLLSKSERSDQIQIQIGAPRPSIAVPVENLLVHRTADIIETFPRSCVWKARFPYSDRSSDRKPWLHPGTPDPRQSSLRLSRKQPSTWTGCLLPIRVLSPERQPACRRRRGAERTIFFDPPKGGRGRRVVRPVDKMGKKIRKPIQHKCF